MMTFYGGSNGVPLHFNKSTFKPISRTYRPKSKEISSTELMILIRFMQDVTLLTVLK